MLLCIIESNIDIVCVLQKMFTHFISEWEEKPDFLPDFDTMIDALYDPDDSDLHYVPVDIDKQSLKKYVQAGKAAKMALLAQQQRKRKKDEKLRKSAEDWRMRNWTKNKNRDSKRRLNWINK